MLRLAFRFLCVSANERDSDRFGKEEVCLLGLFRQQEGKKRIGGSLAGLFSKRSETAKFIKVSFSPTAANRANRDSRLSIDYQSRGLMIG